MVNEFFATHAGIDSYDLMADRIEKQIKLKEVAGCFGNLERQSFFFLVSCVTSRATWALTLKNTISNDAEHHLRCEQMFAIYQAESLTECV